jgi:hypothetical protein
MRCMYGIFGRETTKYTVIYDVYIRFWPILFALEKDTDHRPCLP